MLKRQYIGLLLSMALLAAVFACSGTPEPPASAGELVSRSLEAHGAEALTDWNTMTVEGRIWMNDGVWYEARYLAFAEKPGKLRIEHDMTAAKGRIFNEYFLNDGTAWARRNLIPRRGSVEQMQTWWNQLGGIAYYAQNAQSFFMKDDAAIEWKEASDMQEQDFTVTATIPAYVVGAVMEQDTVDLYFDKKNFHFIQEGSGDRKRMFSGFRDFGDVALPTKFADVVISRRGEQVRENITVYFYDTVEYNKPIESYLFTEDMPGK